MPTMDKQLPLKATGWGTKKKQTFTSPQDKYGKAEAMEKIEKWMASMQINSNDQEEIFSINEDYSEKLIIEIQKHSCLPPRTSSDTYDTSALLSETATSNSPKPLEENNNSKPATSGIFRTLEKIDDMYDLGELAEHNHSSTLAILFYTTRLDDGDYELHTYSYKFGIKIIYMDDKTFNEDLNTTYLIRYSLIGNQLVVKPLFLGSSAAGLIDLKLRINKSLEVRVYALCNFVDFLHSSSDNENTVLWNDSIGKISLTPADRSNLRRKLQKEESETFKPLCLFQIHISADITSSNRFEDKYYPQWTVFNISCISEEGEEEVHIDRTMWPSSAFRLDDLYFHKQSPEGTFFWCPSMRITVFAGANLNTVMNSAGPKYFKKGVMSAIVFPYYQNGEFRYYEALILGPYRVLLVLTEGRILNYKPKSFKSRVAESRQFDSSKCDRGVTLKPELRLDFRRED